LAKTDEGTFVINIYWLSLSLSLSFSFSFSPSLSLSLYFCLFFIYLLLFVCLYFSLHVFLALFFSLKSCKKGKFSPTIWWREMAGIKYQFDICASNQFTILSQFSFRIFVVATLPLNLFSDLFWCSRNSDKCATFFLIMFMHVSVHLTATNKTIESNKTQPSAIIGRKSLKNERIAIGICLCEE
jgi:hypothetical protein